jgi:hypothetical protein
VFNVPKALLCNSSPYFKAALNGSFMEGQTHIIDLDDEVPSIIRTYVAWLYQGQLNSRDIEEALDDSGDFGLHIAEVIVFADKRDIGELKNDAITMLLSYLHTVGLAPIEVIDCIYGMPKSTAIGNLCEVLGEDEVWFGHRLEDKMDHWHPEFMAVIIRIYRKATHENDHLLRCRIVKGLLDMPEKLCEFMHMHTTKEPRCPSLVKNTYFAAPPSTQEPPKKKRRIEPSTQTVELLDD